MQNVPSTDTKILWEDILRTNRNNVDISKKWQSKWRTAIICPRGKKKVKLQCSSYRGICLLDVFCTVVSNNVRRRLVPYVGEMLGDYLCGFKGGRSTVDNLFVLGCILEKCRKLIKY